MKNITLILIALFASMGIGFAQTKIETEKVPEPVRSAFTQKFEGAQKEKWTKDKKNFNVKFRLNKAKGTATFDEKGKYSGGTLQIKKFTELPQAVQESFRSSNFGTWSVIEMFVSETNHEKLYYLRVKTKGEIMRYINFKEDGELKGG